MQFESERKSIQLTRPTCKDFNIHELWTTEKSYRRITVWVLSFAWIKSQQFHELFHKIISLHESTSTLVWSDSQLCFKDLFYPFMHSVQKIGQTGSTTISRQENLSLTLNLTPIVGRLFTGTIFQTPVKHTLKIFVNLCRIFKVCLPIFQHYSLKY